MTLSRRSLLISATALPLVAALPAFAGTTVNVSLWDNPDMDMAMGLGRGMGGNMAMANMHIKIDQTEVPAGDVTFSVVNDSKGIIHEMIVAPLPAPGEPLPYDAGSGRVEEEVAGSRGEVSELEPGQKGALTVDLKPGQYILFCNIAGHYAAGMWTVITVT